MSQDLTPEQREIVANDKALRAQRDGEAMLREIAKNKAPEILGPDGKSLTPSKTLDEQRIESETAFRKEAIAKTDALAGRLKDMVANDKIAASAIEALMDGHRLILWATIELANCDGADDDLLKFADRYLKAAVEHGRGFDIRRLRSRLRDVTMPFLNDRLRHYEALGNLRKKAFARVKPAMKDGTLPLPFPSLSEKFEGGFKPKQMLILSGPKAATDLALEVLRQYFDKRALPTAVLTLSDLVPGRNETIMPLKWWEACTDNLNRLYDTLKSAVNDQRVVTLVESVRHLSCELEEKTVEGGVEMCEERGLKLKVMALHRMYQWTVEHSMCTFMADEPTENQQDALYGALPYVKVSIDDEFLTVGADKVPVKKGS